MPEVLIDHRSIYQWQDPNLWSDYFTRAESVLRAKFTHLDVSDPVRRRVRSAVDIGTYVCAFRPQESSRWLFGRFEGGVELSLRIHQNVAYFPNSLTWQFPPSFIQKDASCSCARQLFDLGNEILRPFYSFGDDSAQIIAKNKTSGSVDLRSELLGVFWVTYFNAAYVNFFGKRKFESIQAATLGKGGSATLVLAECPMLVPDGFREQLAHTLGRRTFVDVNDILGKMPGQHALSFEQLLQFEGGLAGDAARNE